MRNVLYPAGKANYIKMHQGPRNRQKEEQDKLSAAQEDKVTTRREMEEILFDWLMLTIVAFLQWIGIICQSSSTT